MSRVPWHLFQDRQQSAHLIVAVIPLADGPPDGDEPPAARSVLTRFAKKHIGAEATQPRKGTADGLSLGSLEGIDIRHSVKPQDLSDCRAPLLVVPVSGGEENGLPCGVLD